MSRFERLFISIVVNTLVSFLLQSISILIISPAITPELVVTLTPEMVGMQSAVIFFTMLFTGISMISALTALMVWILGNDKSFPPERRARWQHWFE